MAYPFGTAGALRAVPPTAGFYGQGIAYPPDVDTKGRLALSSGLQSVADAMASIVQTTPGERCMHPSYGSNVMVFEPAAPERWQHLLGQQIADNEPRVRPDFDVQIVPSQDGSAQTVSIQYTPVGQATPQTLTAGFFAGPTPS